MSELEPIRFADFLTSRVTALYRRALMLTGSQQEAESLLEEALIRTGLVWREAMLSDPESHMRAVMSRLREEVKAEAEIRALADAPTTHAPPGMAERVMRGIAMRKRRARNRRFAVAAGLAVAVLLALGISALRDPPTAGPSTALSQRALNAPTAPAVLDRIIDRDRAARFATRQPDGLYFRAEALGPNGIVIGGTGFDYDPYRATDGLVWALGPQPGRRISLTPPLPGRAPWAYAAGSTVAAWAEDRGDRFELFCADPGEEAPAPRQVSRTGVATTDRPVHASGDVVVWLDDTRTVQWVRGCAGTPQTLAVPNILGVFYPEVFYSERGRIRALDLESGRSSDVGLLAPQAGPGAPDSARLAFAANNFFAAWAVDGTLYVLDRNGGALQGVGLPKQQRSGVGTAAHTHLTIGDHVVAYALREPESDGEFGFIYDIPSGTRLALATQAFASRDRLLWREGTSYLVAPIRS